MSPFPFALSTVLLVLASLLIILNPASAELQEAEVVDQDALDQYCKDLMQRGGCSACEASADCSFCAPQDDTYHGVCLSTVSPTNCLHIVANGFEGDTYVSAEDASLCPNPPTGGEVQQSIRKADFSANDLGDVKNSYRYTTFHDEFFCAIGFEFPFDRWAHHNIHSEDPSDFDQLCFITNHGFGFAKFPQSPDCFCIQEPCCGGCECNKRNLEEIEVVEEAQFGNTRRYITSAQELIESVNLGCFNEVKRFAPQIHNPYATENGRECVRLMHEAYCTIGCSQYGKPQGFICPDSQQLKELYRLCAAYTSGPNQEGNADCPLDPNNLLVHNDQDNVPDPSHCDDDLRSIESTSYFERTFATHVSSTIPVPERNPFECVLQDDCAAHCQPNQCDLQCQCNPNMA